MAGWQQGKAAAAWLMLLLLRTEALLTLLFGPGSLVLLGGALRWVQQQAARTGAAEAVAGWSERSYGVLAKVDKWLGGLDLSQNEVENLAMTALLGALALTLWLRRRRQEEVMGPVAAWERPLQQQQQQQNVLAEEAGSAQGVVEEQQQQRAEAGQQLPGHASAGDNMNNGRASAAEPTTEGGASSRGDGEGGSIGRTTAAT
jgi:hypothetical protein